jgi:hypothetical protein
MPIEEFPTSQSRRTQAAEGLMRRRWTVAEIDAAVRAGIIYEHERFELIGGEAVPMDSKSLRHEQVKAALARCWFRRLPAEVMLATETTFCLGVDCFVEPDFVFYQKSDGLEGLKPSTCLLAVEIADTSLAWDLGRKTRIYAAHGVREIWVIEAWPLITHIRRRPGVEGYAEDIEVAADGELIPDFAPALAVRLGALELP